VAESEFPDVRRPQRIVEIEPEPRDLSAWLPRLLSADMLSIDIETGAQQIKCVGFGDSKGWSCVVPLVDKRRSDYSYWPDAAAERAAWDFISLVCASDIPKLFQNGLYDVQYLWRYGVPVRNFSHDTMIAHHSLQPEMEKGLGFLGSIYTNESAWKLMRSRPEELKEDE